jgi:hypothetical protein
MDQELATATRGRVQLVILKNVIPASKETYILNKHIKVLMLHKNSPSLC